MDPKVAKLVLAAKKDEQLELNVKVNRIMTILKEHGLLYEAQLNCNDILIHPQNRAGKMCLPAEVRQRLQAAENRGRPQQIRWHLL